MFLVYFFLWKKIKEITNIIFVISDQMKDDPARRSNNKEQNGSFKNLGLFTCLHSGLDLWAGHTSWPINFGRAYIGNNTAISYTEYFFYFFLSIILKTSKFFFKCLLLSNICSCYDLLIFCIFYNYVDI